MTHHPTHVLVIEDDADTRANLRDILALDGCVTETAGTRAEALAPRDWDRIAVILLDRRLPDGTADELLPELRRVAPDAAVIVVTGYADLDGAIVALRLGASDYLLKPVNPEALRASVRRIVEHHRMAAALRASEERLLQAERLAAVGRAITGLAHESRNALQRSQACLEMLARRVEDRPDALDLLQRIQVAQDDLHRLYEEVRAYAAPMHLMLQPVSVSEPLQQAWDELDVRRSGRQALLREESNAADLTVHADRFSLRQVFRNVLENALAACADPVEITVRYEERAVHGRPALEVSVRDNGPGLSPEARERIFEEFFTTRTQGTGLGMAIVRRIIDAHGGEIRVSPPGPGAEIRMTLPRRPNAAR